VYKDRHYLPSLRQLVLLFRTSRAKDRETLWKNGRGNGTNLGALLTNPVLKDPRSFCVQGQNLDQRQFFFSPCTTR